MAISKKIREQITQGSWIRRMFEEGIALKKKHGVDKVFDLSLGNPILEPPPEFRTELLRLAQDETPGTHRYMPNGGFPETRAAVAAALAKETGAAFTAADVIMTCGAGGGMNVALKAILDPGDEVVVIAPYFPEYFFYIDNHGGVTKIASSDPDFLPDTDSLGRALTPRTRAVIVNSPNNPTGTVYPAERLAQIGQAIRRAESRFGTEIYVLSDEPYRKLLFTGAPFPFVLPHHARTVVVTSHSKDLGLAGERIGFLAANPADPGRAEFVEASTYANRTLGFVNAPAMAQRLVARIQDALVDVDAYRKKRDFLYGALSEIGYECVEPQGAFYMFPKSPMPDDRAFVALLQSKLVLVVPGTGFGSPGYFRLSYCVDDRTLEGSVKGFAEAFEEAKSR
ncbi:MAG: pyridoxal phosphate-dependent aminotransferase [Chloroflexi bacterium]|nr:pyridoxal phosphate-dependent aminotransferase [Chloroflexota bacterium]